MHKRSDSQDTKPMKRFSYINHLILISALTFLELPSCSEQEENEDRHICIWWQDSQDSLVFVTTKVVSKLKPELCQCWWFCSVMEWIATCVIGLMSGNGAVRRLQLWLARQCLSSCLRIRISAVMSSDILMPRFHLGLHACLNMDFTYMFTCSVFHHDSMESRWKESSRE